MSVVTTASKPGLKRVLGLWALVIYGIILVQPTAAMPLYGNVADKAHGHVVTTILIGMVAMLFTAISYGRMANAYPTAGSAYSYVGQELHSSLGYLTGWAMVFDYVLNPIISVIWCSDAAMKFLPEVPYPAVGRILCRVVHGSESAGDQSQRPYQSVGGRRFDHGGGACSWRPRSARS